MSNILNIAILGASGYTGAELIRLLVNHPHTRMTALTGESQAGKEWAEVYPHLAYLNLPKLVKHADVDFSAIDLVFCCLPHGTTQDIIASLPSTLPVIDLSADFRLRSLDAYAQWYGHPHQAPALQQEAVYGLVELYRDQLRNARLIANPGCYPTSVLLPLAPLIKAGMVEQENIIIDAKSGVSGAGRAIKQASLYSEINESLSAYAVGQHRHMPEIEQGLADAAGADIQISFTPHLVPMTRGMLSTIYVKTASNAAELRAYLQKNYANEPFVTVLEQGVPATAMVRGSNRCVIGVYDDRRTGHAILVSVIDNLVKGASGQAVQNMNLRMGFAETLGLEGGPLFP